MNLKSHDYIIFALLAVLTLFGGMTYFVKPADPDNAKVIVAGLLASLGIVFTFKFTAHIPQLPPLPPDTKQITQTTTPPVVEPTGVQ